MTSDLLQTIVAAARRAAEVRAGRAEARPFPEPLRAPRGDEFEASLRVPGIRIIGECKRRSPSRGLLRRDYDPASIAREYQAAGAAAISVLTEPTFFSGSLDHLRAVRAVVDVPVLRKDFIVTDFQVLESAASGADAVLLIVGALDRNQLEGLLARARAMKLAALVEVHDRPRAGSGARSQRVDRRREQPQSADARGRCRRVRRARAVHPFGRHRGGRERAPHAGRSRAPALGTIQRVLDRRAADDGRIAGRGAGVPSSRAPGRRPRRDARAREDLRHHAARGRARRPSASAPTRSGSSCGRGAPG